MRWRTARSERSTRRGGAATIARTRGQRRSPLPEALERVLGGLLLAGGAPRRAERYVRNRPLADLQRDAANYSNASDTSRSGRRGGAALTGQERSFGKFADTGHSLQKSHTRVRSCAACLGEQDGSIASSTHDFSYGRTILHFPLRKSPSCDASSCFVYGWCGLGGYAPTQPGARCLDPASCGRPAHLI